MYAIMLEEYQEKLGKNQIHEIQNNGNAIARDDDDDDTNDYRLTYEFLIWFQIGKISTTSRWR